MSNRANYALALAAAGMLAVATAPAAQAVTISPSVTSIDFGNVLIGVPTPFAISFDNSDEDFVPQTTLSPNVSPNPPFSSSVPFAACTNASCLMSIIFTPNAAGQFNGSAIVDVVFGQNLSQRFNISLTGVGVVPVPAALPLFLTGLGGLAYLSRRRKPA